MTNKQLQEDLDKRRWIKSEKSRCDLGGTFDYCEGCKYRSIKIDRPYFQGTTHCNSTYEQRVQDLSCAKSYRRFHREYRAKHN